MVPQAAILIGAGLFGIVIAFAVYAWEQERQQRHRYRQEPSPRRQPAPRPVPLGPCGICGGDVFDEGYPLPCKHYLHATCAADIEKSSQGHPTINLADECRICTISRDKKNTSTRAPKKEGPVVLGPCGICGTDVFDEGYPLPCKHYLHATCAADIENSSQGHPTINLADICRNCVISRVKKEASTRAPENEGLRNRGTNRKICADCRKAFLDDDETKELDCKRHQVHKRCWDAIVASGYTTCALCMEEM